MSKTKAEKVEKAYQYVTEKNPEITNERHLELLTRIHIMRRKKIESGIFFFGGSLLTLLISHISAMFEDSSSLITLLFAVLSIAGPIMAIVGVCKFAKAMHDPLTPNESKELAFFDAIEKGGVANADVSEFDNSIYIQYEQEKYNEASPFKKFIILAKRIPTLVWLFIIVLTIGGLGSSISGVYNIFTHEERNANAMNIQAIVVNIDESYDSDAEETKYTYTYEYTYDGKSYTTSDSSFTKREIGSSKTFLIDSKSPERIIVNDGKSTLTTGIILFSIGVLIFVYSILKVRNLETSFSLFSLFWMLFAVAAIGFAIWGISMIASGDWTGLLVILFGCPMWLMGMFLFRIIFNHKN